MSKKYFLAIVLVLTFYLIFTPNAGAATGGLDTTFGDGGRTVTSMGSGDDGDQAWRAALDSSGRIVAVGWTAGADYIAGGDDSYDFAVARYLADGSLDSTFGTGGKVKIDFNGSDDSALAVAIDSSGNIVVGGVTIINSAGVYDIALARLTTSGSLDPTFGTGGKVTTDFGGNTDNLNALVLQSDGKIVAVGDTISTSRYHLFALVRYNTNGTLDSTFDTDGKVTTDFNVNLGTDGVSANAVTLDASSRIVIAGKVADGYDFALARYNTDGSLDTTFDTDGKVTTDFGGNDSLSAMAIDASGKIVLAGFTTAATSDFAVARYNTNGSLDTTFDTDGKLTTDFNNFEDEGFSMVIYGSSIIVGGFASSGSTTDFAVAVYKNDGSLDTSYGNGGKLTYDFNSAEEYVADIKVQPDSQVILVGSTIGGTTDFALSRFNGPLAEGVKSVAGANGTVTSDTEGDGATSTDPLETSVTTPTGGTVSIFESQTASTPVSGYGVLNQKVVISAPVETAANPLRISFKIDASIIPGGVNKNNIDFYRNGTKVKNCLGSTVASPDPCITTRADISGGGIQIDILTSQASTWGMSGPATGLVAGMGDFDLENSAFFGTEPSGLASFKLGAAYKKNGTLEGQFKLSLQSGSKFESSNINWLWTDGLSLGVVSGSGSFSDRNGEYGFQIMIDSGSKSIRIIITKAEVLIFDNLFGTNVEFGAGNLEPINGKLAVK